MTVKRLVTLLVVGDVVVMAAIAGVCFWPEISEYGLLGMTKSLDGLPTSGPTSNPSTRPAEWARPVDKPGLANLFKVNDGLYRGARPTAEGIRQLKELGIKTVVNLEMFHLDDMMDTGIRQAMLPVSPLGTDEKQVAAFLKLVTDKANQPAFVHCQFGSDRTGTMCAMYRIVVQGWTKDDAIGEMTLGGFGYHPMWQNLLDFIRHADVEGIKKHAGLTK